MTGANARLDAGHSTAVGGTSTDGAPHGFPSVPRLSEDGTERLRRTLLWLIGGRLAVGGVLLGATLAMSLRARAGPESFTPRYLLALIGAIFAASLMSAIALRRPRRLQGLAGTQLVVDVLATSGLVYITGGFASGFTFLYGVTALMGALMMGPPASRLTGAFALSSYLGIGTLLLTQVLPIPPDQLPASYSLTTSEATYMVLVNVLGLSLVILLADNLSTRLRSAGGRLRVAEASAQRLAQLHEDIVRSLTSGLVTTDMADHILSLNPTALDMFRTTKEALIGRPIAEVLPITPGDARSSKDLPVRAEGTARRTDGSTFPVGYSANRLVNAEGVAFGRVVVFQDLTEISQLREAAERAERLATLGRLSAGLAHEIRNPLSSISGSVELVRESPRIDDEERRLLHIVLGEVDRLNELVSTMLEVGKPRPPQLACHNLTRIVSEVIEMAGRGLSVDAQVEIVHARSTPDLEARFDADQMRQVVWNLLKNAIQASPPHTRVEVGETCEEKLVILTVRDQGRGLSPTQMKRIFEMFYSGRAHGVGLGLALVRQIVDLHGGRVDVESEAGSGATFRVLLPRD